jgi:hypothetical protein
MIETEQEYLDTLPDHARAWVREFTDYVRATYPGQDVTMFRQRPMFKLGRTYQEGYVMFTAAAAHFSAHSVDFDLVQAAKDSIPGSKGGKGSVSVRYTDESAKPALRAFVDAVMARHGVTPA